MDFDKFIEKDIIEFLDKKSQEMANKIETAREEEFNLYEITEDYTKEINDALKSGDILQAQKIFEEVKEKHAQAPEGSLSRKRLYVILEEIYERIKDYENKEEGKKNLFETIREYEKAGLFSKPEMFEQKQEEAVTIILSSIGIKEKELEDVTHKEPYTAEDLNSAINKYREMKELIKRIPPEQMGVKSKESERALNWYYVIKKMKEQLLNKPIEKPSKPVKSVEERLNEIRMLKEKIVEIHSKLTELVNKKDIKSAIDEYRRLKKLCSAFPDDLSEEKTALLAYAISIYEQITKLKQESGEAAPGDDMKSTIISKLEKIDSLVKDQDVDSAVREYAKVKELFRQYPDTQQDKKELFNKIVDAHKKVLVLEGQKLRKPSSQSVQINDIITKVSDMLDANDTDTATRMLLEAKHNVEMMPKDSFSEKVKLLKRIDDMEHKMLFVKNILKMNDSQKDTRVM